MLAYIVRRLVYAIPILIGVNLLTFALFFVVNTPDQMARVQLGDKHVTEDAVQEWKAQRGYDKPLLINGEADGAEVFIDTIFFEKSLSLFYVIAGQFFFAKEWSLVPISGYLGGADAWRFLLLPVIIGVISGIGGGTRLYRTLFLEEANKDYVRTARAKGVAELTVLFRHILPNGMIPILTSVVVVIPSLFMGSLLVESFFGIPGLGSYTLDAIQSQDFAIVRSMVFLGSVLYIIGLLLTDISYTLVDPRVRLS